MIAEERVDRLWNACALFGGCLWVLGVFATSAMADRGAYVESTPEVCVASQGI